MTIQQQEQIKKEMFESHRQNIINDPDTKIYNFVYIIVFFNIWF